MINLRLVHAFAILAVTTPSAVMSCVPLRETVTIALPDFQSAAEIVSPPASLKQRGFVLLFPGSDVADLDGAIMNANGKIVSRPMRQVADTLACAGFVSLRYNKRYVSGSTRVDREKFDTLSGVDFANDAKLALNYAKTRPETATLPMGLIGWSEGTTVAMTLAATEPDVRAIVLMAPVVETAAIVAQKQYGRIGKPYLMRYATNGALDAKAIARADAGPGGELAHIFVRMFRGFRPGEAINPLLDTNNDTQISFTEADPILAGWYADNPNGGLGASATGRALKGLAESFVQKGPPILILQGTEDSMIAPDAAREFVSRPNVRQRIKLFEYSGLGHSLGKTTTAENDMLLPVDQKPLNDMAKWLKRTMAQ